MLFIFLDGVGIGKASCSNPFYAADVRFLPFFEGGLKLPDGTPIKPIDALMGVDGHPQSATGQTTLFTGVNAPALLEQHKGSYPNRTLRKTIKQRNILKVLLDRKLKAGFINVYPFCSHLFQTRHVRIDEQGMLHFSADFPRTLKRRISVTTCMIIANELHPYSEHDIVAGQAIYQDYTNRSIMKKVGGGNLKDHPAIPESAIKIPEFSPERAAQVLYNASQRYDFLLYEYFQTDLYGHRHCMSERIQLIRRLDAFLDHLLLLMDPREDTLILTSDHGNLEDASNLAHTTNPVPLITWGKGSRFLRERIDSLVDVLPAIEDFFDENPEK